MDNLISRKAAIEELGKMAIALYGYDSASVISCAIYKLQNLPSAQPEQKKGRWIDEKINSYTKRISCSECGNSAPFICVSGDYYGRNMHGEPDKTKFCPNCGADMRGEEG